MREVTIAASVISLSIPGSAQRCPYDHDTSSPFVPAPTGRTKLSAIAAIPVCIILSWGTSGSLDHGRVCFASSHSLPNASCLSFSSLRVNAR